MIKYALFMLKIFEIKYYSTIYAYTIGLYFKKYKMNISGIIHIGANLCEELNDYLKCNVVKDKIIWVEANPKLFILIYSLLTYILVFKVSY